jgi:hypothetical protein
MISIIAVHTGPLVQALLTRAKMVIGAQAEDK